MQAHWGHGDRPGVRRTSTEWVPIVCARNSNPILAVISKHTRDVQSHLQSRLLKEEGRYNWGQREDYTMLEATIISGGLDKLF